MSNAAPAFRLDDAYEEAEALLAQKRLKEASAKCQEILNVDPRFAPGWFLFGKLYVETGNHAKAVEMFSRAIANTPQPDTAFFYLRGLSHLALEDWASAREDLEMVIELTPDNGEATLLLASACIRLGDRKAAHLWLDRAGRMGRGDDALEQRSLLLQEEGRTDEALAAVEQRLALHPGDALSLAQRGNLRLQQGDENAALADANAALTNDPTCERAWLVKGLAHMAKEEHPQAIFAVMQSVNRRPDLLQSRHLLANAHLRGGDTLSTVDQYRQILSRWPEDPIALSQLPTLLMAMGEAEEARGYLDQALAADPDNLTLQHFAAAGKSETTSAHPDYVSSLFDAYAGQFDQSLQEKLGYRIPEKAAALLASLPAMKPGLSLLDLGCGTGLGAVALESLTARRVGIDLSPKMLEKADERKLYDELYVSGIEQFLEETEETFDLIAALDVFVYVGALEETFLGVRAHLAAGGRFVFSLERDDQAEAGFLLRPSGRFAHAASYVEALAAQHGLTLLKREETDVRSELGKPLAGYLYCFSA